MRWRTTNSTDEWEPSIVQLPAAGRSLRICGAVVVIGAPWVVSAYSDVEDAGIFSGTLFLVK
jgi:hypothetical protein